jgi:F-type H+-transporting ATPase subunit b
MPQLDFSTFSNQIFWLIVTLVAIYFILSRLALPRIAGVLAERQGTINNDVNMAEELKEKAVAAEDAYNKALNDARSEAARIVEATKAEIKEELDAAIAMADAQISEKAKTGEEAIAEIRSNALASVKEVAAATTADLVVALGGKSDTKAVTAAVKQEMKG